MKRFKTGITVILLFLFCNLLLSKATTSLTVKKNLYDDIRLAHYSDLFRKSEFDKLLRSVNSDLKENTPHPLSSWIWVRMHWIIGDTNSALSEASSKVREKVTDLAQIYMMDMQGNDQMLVKSYPLEKAKKITDFFSLYILANAYDDYGSSDAAYELGKYFLKQFPDEYLPVQSILNLVDEQKVRFKMEYELNKGEFDKTQLAKKVLLRALKFLPVNFYDYRDAIELFLQYHPNDAGALRFRGHKYYDAEKYGDAINDYKSSFRIDPFYDFYQFGNPGNKSLISLTNALMRLQRYKEAEDVLRQNAKLLRKDTLLNFYNSNIHISAITGNKWRVMELIRKAESNFPEAWQIHYRKGKLAQSNEQYSKAIKSFKRAIDINSNNRELYDELLESYIQAKIYPEAIALFEEIKNKFDYVPASKYDDMSDMYRDNEEYAEALEVIESVNYSFYHPTIIRAKAVINGELGETSKAISLYHRYLELRAPTTWDLNNLFSLYIKEKAGDKSKALLRIRELIDRYPWSEPLWTKLADEQLKVSNKLEVWDEAVKKNKGREFPFQSIRVIAFEEKDWKIFTSRLDASIEDIELLGGIQDKIGFSYQQAVWLVDKLQREDVTEAEMEMAKKRFEHYLSIGGYDGAYYSRMAEIYGSVGDKKKAAEMARKGMAHRPDDYDLYWDLVTKYERGGTSRKKFLEFWKRDPFDEDRTKSYVKLNTTLLWGGSDINALCIIDWIKNNDPKQYDANLKKQEARCLSGLGDNSKEYELDYGRRSGLGNSNTYISMHRSARKRARQEKVHLHLDPNTHSVTLTFPDGTICRQQDHPELSLPIRFEVGKAFISTTYDNEARVTSINSSNGRFVEIGYNSDGNITNIRDSEGRNVLLTYDDKGRQTRIELAGLGRIEIGYDKITGLSESVTAYDTNDKEVGYTLVGEIFSTFEELQKLTSLIGQAKEDIQNRTLPDLGYYDEELNLLKNALYTARNSSYLMDEKLFKPVIKATLDLLNHLFKNLHTDSEYGFTLVSMLTNLFAELESTGFDKAFIFETIDLISLYHRTLLLTKGKGIDESQWRSWSLMQDWLENTMVTEDNIKNRKKIQAVKKSIKENPIKLLGASSWFDFSFLQNTGYWKRYEFADVFEGMLGNVPTINTVFKRTNGDVILGTDAGLFVQRRGYWERFVYHETRGEFVSKLNATKIQESSSVLSIGESMDGELYIGTANGLYVPGEEYRGKVKKRITELDGLPSNYITSISNVLGDILIGTAAGMSRMSFDEISDVVLLPGERIEFIRSQSEIEDSEVLIGTSSGLFIMTSLDLDFPEMVRISDVAVDAAIYDEQGQGYVLHQNQINRIKIQYEDKGILVSLIPIREKPTFVNNIYGFSRIPVDANETALGVLTDQGISIYKNHYFQHLRLPLANQIAQAKNASNQDEGLTIVSNDAIYNFEQDRIKIEDGFVVNAIVSSSVLGRTFVADGGSLTQIWHNDPDAKRIEAGAYLDYTSLLALDDQHRVILNDGLQIIRRTFDPDSESYSSEELLYCEQSDASGRTYESNVRSISITSDGTIWVAAGASLFRYKEVNNEVITQEFSYFRNQELFPSMSNSIYNVIETLSGDILAICSNNFHNGPRLQGGILRWNSEAELFERIDIKSIPAFSDYWMMSGYTQISDDEAIIGTNGGFVHERSGNFFSYRSFENPTYKKLVEDKRLLFMGTEGVSFGQDLWLFGCATGVVAYNIATESWFYPERINWMLPLDTKYGNTGGRFVNALATDPNGRIYVGTDSGLLVYDSDGSSAADFLMENMGVNEAFVYQNSRLLRNEAEQLIASLGKNDNYKTILSELESLQSRIKNLDRKTQLGNSLAMAEVQMRKSRIDSLTAIKIDLQKQHTRELLKLEQKDPALHQLLTIKPLNLFSLRDKFADDEVAIQYLPMKERLFIHLVSRDKTIFREVLVSREELESLALSASKRLSSLAKYDWANIEILHAEQNSALMLELEKLYELLLRPIDNHISGYKNVYIVPFDILFYVPFACLIDRISDKEFAYAIAKHNFGYLPSMYSYMLLLNHKESDLDNYLLFGDPDGSLKHARNEVEKLSEKLKNDRVFLGKDATSNKFKQFAPESRLIHLATHAFLNQEDPSKSTVLFADTKMTIPEIFNLSLDKSDAVVLSACETGRGLKGMEFSTIARAFNNAGVPTVVATLWRVADEPSEKLILDFYNETNENYFSSLAQAQRKMLSSRNKNYSHPSKWAGFIVIGKH